MLRMATMEDLPVVMDMAMKFAEASKYKDFVEKDRVENFVINILKMPVSEGIIILYEKSGMIAAVKTPFMFGSIPIGNEVAWWVEPEVRKQGIGDILVSAFEDWAKRTGCEMVTLAFLDINLSKYMKTKGYDPYESAHMKVI